MTFPQLQPADTRPNGWAIAAIVVGALSLVGIITGVQFAPLGSFLALFLGLDGLRRAKKLGGKGLWLAIVGTVLGSIPLLVVLVAFIGMLLDN